MIISIDYTNSSEIKEERGASHNSFSSWILKASRPHASRWIDPIGVILNARIVLNDITAMANY